MPKVTLNIAVPGFSLEDSEGNVFNLADSRGKQNVLLIFNRGFIWPFCQKHMVQLRHDYEKISKLDTTIVVVGPEEKQSFRRYWRENNLPFIGLPDPQHSVLKLFGQEVNLFKLGRMPAQVVVDKKGIARYAHYGHEMSDIPPNAEVVAILEEINQD